MNEKGDLVCLLDLDDGFIIDLKYATVNNFTKQIVYRSDICYINNTTARLLIEAKNKFKLDGYKVKVWDAYRPISAQKRFYEIMPDPNFVAIPPDMSKTKTFRPSHLNGQCVDVTLVDSNGNELNMPTEFDDFSCMAGLGCPDISEESRKNAEYLRDVMESVGFKGYENEWWHFYDMINIPSPYLDFQI